MRQIVAVLENLRSLYNVGAAFRTAEGLGVEHLYLTGFTGGAQGLNEPIVRQRVAKTALGTESILPWTKREDTAELLKELKDQGFVILALEQTADAVSLVDWSRGGQAANKVALIVGNELYGVTESTLRTADVRIQFPMHGQKESMNASVAFGIALSWIRWN